MDTIEIKSLSEYIFQLMELKSKNIHIRSSNVSSLNFYRGQSKLEWGLAPRLFRENLLHKEEVLINEFMRVSPLEFQNLSYFDILVKMQHYGLPTRLLDTTFNPLIALFFASYGEAESDGAVYAFQNLPVFKQGVGEISIIMKYVFEYSSRGFQLNSFINDLSKLNFDSKIHSRDYTIKKEMLRLLTEIPFLSVLPNLNNQRIINQDGAFFLFGMKIEKNWREKASGTETIEYYDFTTIEYTNEVDNFWPNSLVFKIPKESKDTILDELQMLGITKNKMFPELEYQAEYITKLIKMESQLKRDE
jgi:hypothetical protein